VQISGGTHKADMLQAQEGEEYPVIASRPSQLQAVFDQAPELINRFIALVDRANLLLGPGNQEHIAQSLKNLSAISGTLAEGGGDVKQLLSDASSTMARLETAAAQAETLMGAFADRGERLAENLDEGLAEGRVLIRDASVMAAAVTQAAQETVPVMQRANSAMEDFSALAAELRPEVGPTARKARAAMEEFAAMTGEMRNAVTAMEQAAGAVGRAAGQAEGILTENRDAMGHFANGGLYEFTQLMTETRQLIRNLTRLSEEIERDPARFFFGDAQKGYETQ